MKNSFAPYGGALVVFVIVTLYCDGLHGRHKMLIDDERSKIDPSLSKNNLKEMLRKIAYNQIRPEPYKVLALMEKIWSREERVTHPFEWRMVQTSNYYSQIKYLAQQKRWSEAAYFLWLHWSHATVAAAEAKKSERKLTPTDLEVISAGNFALAVKLPVGLKWMYHKSAERPLLLAIDSLRRQGGRQSIEHALVAAKLFRLTGDIAYRYEVKRVGKNLLTLENLDTARVADHLGMTVAEMFEYFKEATT